MIIDVEAVLNRMAKDGKICSRSILENVLEIHGKQVPVTNRALRKAMSDRGAAYLRLFMKYALGWDDDLISYLRNLESSILWGPRSRARTWKGQVRTVQNIHIAAVKAWIKEIEKP